jgi:hypothetical protein
MSFPSCGYAPRIRYGRIFYFAANPRNLLFQFLAAAGRTRWDFGRENQEFELSVAFLAIVIVKRHRILALSPTWMHVGLVRPQETFSQAIIAPTLRTMRS